MADQMTVHPTSVRRRPRVAPSIDLQLPGIIFFLLAAAFFVVTMLAASIAPGYDFHAAAISDLGVTAQTALLFNGLLVIIGLTNIAAGYLLYRRRHHP